MWWFIIAVPFLLVAWLFWPTRIRQFKVFCRGANQALARRDWKTFDRRRALALEAAEGIRRNHVREYMLGDLALMAAQGAYWRGEIEETQQQLKLAIERIELAGAPDRGIKLAMARHLWGDACFDAGELDQAEDQFRAAVQALDFAGNAAMAIFSQQRLGDALLEARKFDEAREVAEQCVAMERKILGAQTGAGNAPAISMTMPDLCLANRDFPQAEKLFREKAEYWSKMVPRPDNIDVTRYQFHLAAAQREQGHLDDAAKTLRKACETAERDFGPQHPRVQRARKKLSETEALIAIGN
jgi:tetratricopeptide (TPR) repeat protein